MPVASELLTTPRGGSILPAAILKVRSMRFIVRVLLLLTCMLWGRLYAQLPFYTDDTVVTERGKWHFEFFNEYALSNFNIPI